MAHDAHAKAGADMQLHQSTWQEIDAYLASSKGIVIPIGSTEQHGPNGLLGTDAICPEVIARRAGDQAGILIGPTFNVGQAQHHLGFAGTISLRPSTMIAALQDWTASLVRHGFERIYWFNGHGGNIATINAAFSEIYAEWSLRRAQAKVAPVRCLLRNWWELPGVGELRKELFPVGEGSHATASEVSVTYAAYPDAIKRVEMTPKIAPHGPILDADDYRRRFPDGRIGSDPSQATPEKGERLIAAASKAMIRDYEAFLKAA
jgi:creatinine amidohydrolase/Fe(II)-dependent formamide hydrolase-like protein